MFQSKSARSLPLHAEQRETQVEPGKPEQFCTPMDGTENGRLISVAAYPVAWRVETSNDERHRGFEYIRSDRVFLNALEQLTDASF